LFSASGVAQFAALGGLAGVGKTAALDAGIRELEGCVDLIVLSDADVLLDSAALIELEAAFRADSRLGLASARQVFVRRLDAEPYEPAGDLHDRLSSQVRRAESRFGRLVNAHGQCMAWRSALGLRVPAGLAADDLGLVAGARARGFATRWIPQAVFYEEKPADEGARGAQRLRRARAFVQARRLGSAAFGQSALDRWHWACYRHLHLILPAGLGLAALAWLALSLRWLGPRTAHITFGLLAAAAALGPGLPLLRTSWLLWRALLRERREPLADRWETSRA
jgi:hypothetical protein